MNELVKYEPKYGLTFKQQVTYAQQHSMVRDCDEDLVHNIINIHLGKCLQLTGFKFEDEQEFDFLLSEVKKEILSHAKGLRISEIPIAFDRGIKKVYGDWFGISVVTFTGFIHSYLKDPERLKIIRELEPEKKEPPKKFDGQKRFDDLKKEFDEKGTCEDIGNLVYDWLIEEGKIEKGYGNQFYEQAKITLIEMQKHLLKDEKNKFIRQSVTNVLHQIEGNSSSLIVVLAKKIAVNNYLKNNQP